MLATEETKTVTNWRGTNGKLYTSKRVAEINSIAEIIGFTFDLERLDSFLHSLVNNSKTREWLLGQLNAQPKEKACISVLEE